jgi:hypothetical protein
MERFYRTLATGATVGAALRRARLDAIAAGRPVEAWAGFVLLGDGSRSPVRPGPPSFPGRWLAIAALGALAAWLASRLVRRAWRSRPS